MPITILCVPPLRVASWMARLAATPAIATVDISRYDAVFIAGGQSPMVTFPNHVGLHDFVRRVWEADKVLGIVCHATCLLLTATDAAGTRLVDGRTWTGFADAEEAFADAWVGQRIQPFWIETEAKKLPSTNFITGGMFRPFAVRDGRLITGQQQFSGAEAARLIIEAVGR